MTERDVAVVSTGTANLASVLAGLRRAGAQPRISREIEDVKQAQALVLPGVGAMAAAMETIHEYGLADALKERIASGKPTLAICLGLQILGKTSEESPEARGLGVFDAHVSRFSGNVRIPQLGWNRVVPGEGCNLLRPGYAYFANSYKFDAAPDGWHAATCDHGGEFVAALEKNAVLACQFHPELSGAWGLELLKRWLDRAFSSEV